MRIIAAFVILALSAGTLARQNPDAGLAGYIDGIKAIDAHAHPLTYTGAGTPADTDFDALPLDGLPPFNVPWGLRPEHPAYREAQVALYGLRTADTGAAYATTLNRARTAILQREGVHFPAWVLDQAGIDVMLANRIAMGPGLTRPRFRWIAFADALMLPLDWRDVASTPDRARLYPLEARLLRRYLRDLGLTAIPASLRDYERDVLAATLARQRAAGAVAIKFEAAYLRRLDFDPPDSLQASAIYARYAKGSSAPTAAEYKALQDYLFRVITREAGRLGLAVQIHATDIAGASYEASGSAPHLLESVFNDSTLRATTFVIVHGGWPLVEETMSMLGKPDVYADISLMDIVAEPAALARVLRLWLAAWPENPVRHRRVRRRREPGVGTGRLDRVAQRPTRARDGTRRHGARWRDLA